MEINGFEKRAQVYELVREAITRSASLTFY
jgi:hypothetical protein